MQFDSQTADFPFSLNNHEEVIDVNGNVKITLPDGFPDGWWCVVTNVGTGIIDWTATNPVQVDGTEISTQYTSFQATHIGGDIWRIEGRTV